MDILVATRHMSDRDLPVQMALRLQNGANNTLTFLHVSATDEQRPAAERTLKALRTALGGGPALRSMVRVGKIAATILATATDGGFDLLVVGHRPRHARLRPFRIGPAERILASRRLPTLVVRGEASAIRHVLLCESGREPTLLARVQAQLPALLAQAERLTVLHVMSQIAAAPGVPGWELRADAEALIEEGTPEGQLLEEEIALLEPAPVEPEAKVRHGLVVDEILAEAREGDYDVVIIGAIHETGWRRYLLDDLADQILREVDRPVLVL